MVYADVPEHEGFDKGEVPDPRPTTTDGWLARISDQLQVFVDAINDAREGDEDGSGGDPETPETPDGADDGKGDEAGKADDKSTTPAPAAKKTTAAKAEVKGD